MSSHDAVADDLCSDRTSQISNPIKYNPFRGRGNFFDDKMPGCRLPGWTAATACRLKSLLFQEGNPFVLLLSGNCLRFYTDREVLLQQQITG